MHYLLGLNDNIRNMIRESFYKAVSLLMIVILFQSCTSSKYIYSKNDSTRIPSKLKIEDKNKKIKVYQADTLYVSGQLFDFNNYELQIYTQEKSDTISVNFSQVDKVALEEKEVPLALFLIFLGLCYGLYSLQDLSDELPKD